MLRPRFSLVLVVLTASAALAASTPAPGHATTLWLAVGVVKTEAEAYVSGDPDDNDALRAAKRVIKFANKATKQFDKARSADTYVKETRFASRGVALAEKKLLPSDFAGQALDDAMESVSSHYSVDLLAARDRLAAASAKTSALRRRLKQADKFLARADEALTHRSRYAALAKVARATNGFSADDPIVCGDDSGDEGTWVISSLRLLEETESSVDLNGDGLPDDAARQVVDLLAPIPDGPDAAEVNALLAAELAEAEDVAVLQFWGLDGFASDPCAFVGVLNAADTDADPADNFGGTEVFDGGASLDEQGHAVVNAATTIRADGSFGATMTAQGQSIAFLPAVPDGPLVIVGVAAPQGPTGVIAFALSEDDVIALVEQLGVEVPPQFLPLLSQILDLDVDGDGENDALSIALAFETVPCGLAR